MVPAALAVTAGIVIDCYASIPLAFSLVMLLAGLAAWAAARSSPHAGLPLVYLAGALLAFGAAYHHGYRDVYAQDDIGNLVTADPRPVQLRGKLAEEPNIIYQQPHDPLRFFPRPNKTKAVVQVGHLMSNAAWVPVSGRAQLVVSGELEDFHVGDEIEVNGQLESPAGPANPGEFDYASYLRDQRIRAEVHVQKTTEGVRRLAEGWRWSLTGWLAQVHGWAQRTLQTSLPESSSGVATALLLGEGSTMTTEDWEKYIRTGVIHVLAISGQHLVVLAGFLWIVLRLLRVRRRQGAVPVALFLLAYSLLAGGRPPVMRAAVTVCVACGGILLRRPVLTANSFALAWLIVAILSPTDLFGAGCQLSFLAVAILYWGVSRWFRFQPDPLERLIDESRPSWQRPLHRLGGQVALAYAVTAVVWLGAAPLVAARYHMVSPVALLIGPPLVLLTSIALISGFLLLLAAALCGPIVPLFAWITHWSLAACEFLVNLGDRLPGGHWYVGDVAGWWLWVFYPIFLGVLMLEPLRRHWRWTVPAGLGWLCVGLVSGWSQPPAEEMRCTFIAVGHGGCTVIETPDGRTLLYDAGSLAGPDVTQRQIAPFLWQRGIRRIDEVFLSHADMDHFNGLPALIQRFSVGQVSCTPTFADKSIEGVTLTLQALQRQGIPVRIIKAGDRLWAGPVEIEVLHPPPPDPTGKKDYRNMGKENFRSLVLRVRHEGHAILLTGDLEGLGLEQVLAQVPQPVDVFMAPHHGSRAGDKKEVANRKQLARQLHPQVIVSCQGLPKGSPLKANPYEDSGATFLGTWPHGAITIRSMPGNLTVETYATGQRLVFPNR